jgi:hypothetical protein
MASWYAMPKSCHDMNCSVDVLTLGNGGLNYKRNVCGVNRRKKNALFVIG